MLGNWHTSGVSADMVSRVRYPPHDPAVCIDCRRNPGTCPLVPGFFHVGVPVCLDLNGARSVYAGGVSVAVFLLALGATARITRFINADVLAGPIRALALRIARGDDDHWLPYLARCPWCASIWIAAATFTLTWYYAHTPAWWITTAALSASYLVGLLADVLDPSDEE